MPDLVASLSAPRLPFDGRPRWLRYREACHADLPHVIKFSGGRSSGCMLISLLREGLLRADRGDVVVFNNTSAEHPATYAFIRAVQTVVERDYALPMFWTEWTTVEIAGGAGWERRPRYRLVKPRPVEDDPDGYHWRGEVFEAFLAHAGKVPTPMRRVCSIGMKLKITERFLHDWLTRPEGLPALGADGTASRVTEDALMARHRARGGSRPASEHLRKKAYLETWPPGRAAQPWAAYSPVTRTDRPVPGWPSEWVSLVGIRGDEPVRVMRVKARRDSEEAEGEYVYLPLAEVGAAADDINAFWRQMDFDLGIDSRLGNCTYCFMKGGATLQHVVDTLQPTLPEAWRGTPQDVEWWRRIERTYGDDLQALGTGRTRKFLGFVGADGGETLYDRVRPGGRADAMPMTAPCACTD